MAPYKIVSCGDRNSLWLCHFGLSRSLDGFLCPLSPGPGLHPSWWGLWLSALSSRLCWQFCVIFSWAPSVRARDSRSCSQDRGPTLVGPVCRHPPGHHHPMVIIIIMSLQRTCIAEWHDALQCRDVITRECLWPVHLCRAVLINSCDYILMVTLRLPPTGIIRCCYAIMSRDKAIIFCRLASCCFRVMSRTLSLSSAFSGMILSLSRRPPRLSTLSRQMSSPRSSPPTPSRPAPSSTATRTWSWSSGGTGGSRSIMQNRNRWATGSVTCCQGQLYDKLYDETILRIPSSEKYWEMPPPVTFIRKPLCRDFCANSHCGIKMFTSNLLEWKIYTFHFYSDSKLHIFDAIWPSKILSFEHCDWRINIMSEVWPKNFWAHQIERNIYLSSVSRYKKSRELFHQSVRGPQVLLWVWGRREESGKKLMETANMFQLLRSIRRKKSSNLFAASFPNYLQTSFNIHHNTTFILYGTTVVNMKVEKWRSEC